MVVFVIVTDFGLGNVYLDHGQAIDEYNNIVKLATDEGAKITKEIRADGDSLHGTKFQFPFLPHENWVQLIRREVKGRVLQAVPDAC